MMVRRFRSVADTLHGNAPLVSLLLPCNDVRHDIERVNGDGISQRPKGLCDHLTTDQQNAMLVTDLTQSAQYPFGGTSEPVEPGNGVRQPPQAMSSPPSGPHGVADIRQGVHRFRLHRAVKSCPLPRYWRRHAMFGITTGKGFAI